MAKVKSKRAAQPTKQKDTPVKTPQSYCYIMWHYQNSPTKPTLVPKLSYNNIMQNSPASRPARSDGTALLYLNGRVFH